MEIAGLEVEPKVVEGQSEMGMALFCMVDEEAKGKIGKYLAMLRLGDMGKEKHDEYRGDGWGLEDPGLVLSVCSLKFDDCGDDETYRDNPFESFKYNKQMQPLIGS